MLVKPKNKWLVVKPLDQDEKIGGLYVPGTVRNEHRLADVVAAADDVEGISAGERVVYDTLGTVVVKVGDSEIHFIKAVNVLGSIDR